MPEPSMGMIPNLVRRYQPRFEVLCNIYSAGGETVQTATTGFRVYIPDSRLRCRIDILFSPAGGIPFGAVVTTQLKSTAWIFGAVQDDTGTGASGLIPVTNIWGTANVFAPVIQSDGLWGLSLTEISAIDAVVGQVTFDNTWLGAEGTWYVGACFSPVAVELEDRVWERLTSQCRVEVIGNVPVLHA